MYKLELQYKCWKQNEWIKRDLTLGDGQAELYETYEEAERALNSLYGSSVYFDLEIVEVDNDTDVIVPSVR